MQAWKQVHRELQHLMSHATINFKDLRRLERIRIRQEILKSKEAKLEPDDEKDENTIGRNVEHEVSTIGNRLHPTSVTDDAKPCQLKKCDHDFSAAFEAMNPGIPHGEILNSYKVGDPDICSDIYYMRNFLPSEFSKKLVEWLKTLPHATIDASSSSIDKFNGKWNRLKHAQRNVAMFDLKRIESLENQKVPYLLDIICKKFVEMNIFSLTHPPNHVLINEYEGCEGILPHTDGPVYLDRTATISVGGGDVLFNFTKRDFDEKNEAKSDSSSTNTDGNTHKCALQIQLHGEGSLVVFTGDAYSNHLHSIADRVDSLVEHSNEKCVNSKEGEKVFRGYRLSLTFRHKFR